MYLPVRVKVMDGLIVCNMQIGIEAYQASLTEHAIIKKERVLATAYKTTGIHLPGVIQQSVLLKMEDLKILIEVDYIYIGCNDLRSGTADRTAQIIIYRQALIGPV